MRLTGRKSMTAGVDFAAPELTDEAARAPASMAPLSENVDSSGLRYFAVTTAGLTATRWLSHVLASHPDVYVAHGKFALDSVIAGDFHKEKETANRESLSRGNETRVFYETRPLEEVLTLYRGIKPNARAYGCVHSYTMHTLAQAAHSADTLAGLRILNVVRHPVAFIASHEALVRAAEAHPRLYQFYLDEVWPNVLRQFPELYLMKCPDYRAFIAFALGCHAVNNLVYDLCYPGIRHLQMETLTSDQRALSDFCRELTGLDYSTETLQEFIRLGAINQHRPGPARRDPHDIYAGWLPWQRDMAQMMISGLVLDWLESLGYDLGMLRAPAEPAPAAETNHTSCLADCLRALDPRHPMLAFLTAAGATRTQIVETDYQGYRLVRHQGRIVALARSVGWSEFANGDEAGLRDLQEDGLYIDGESVADLWRKIARVVSSSPQLIEIYRDCNLIQFRDKWYAAPIGIAMTLERTNAAERRQLSKDNKLIAGPTMVELKQRVDETLAP
jgi:hypothetical protein